MLMTHEGRIMQQRHAPHPTYRTRTCGFTLVEVLAATVAGAIVLGLGYTALSAGRTTRNTAQNYAAAHGSLRAASTTIRNDLHAASAASIQPNGTLLAPPSGAPGFQLTRTDGTSVTYELHGTVLRRTTAASNRPVATHVRSVTASGDASRDLITITLAPTESPYPFEITQHVRQP